MKGFTLVETMIAITILTFAMAGPLFTADRAIVAAQTARDQLTATYLAQEGIEYVRMMRDNEYLKAYHTYLTYHTDIAGIAWSDFLTGADASSITRCIAPNTCKLDPKAGTVESCSGDSCDSLYLDGCTRSAEGLSCTPSSRYIQQGLSESVQTPYTRTIQAIDVSPTEEKIVSTVSWTFHGTPYSVTVSDHLTAWQ